MSFHYRYRKEILIGVICILMLGGGIFFLYKNKFFEKEKKVKKKDDIVIKKDTPSIKKKTESNYYKVDIKGEINSPGIYTLKSDSRVIDVINSAGGLTEQADTTVINLSKKIKDEMVIIIYSKSEVIDFKKTKEIEKQVEQKCIKKDEESLTNDACITDNNTTQNITNKININTAGVDQLKTLPGIGDSKAKNIIDYREKNGLFKNIEELKNVDGIGDNLYAQVEMFITVE